MLICLKIVGFCSFYPLPAAVFWRSAQRSSGRYGKGQENSTAMLGLDRGDAQRSVGLDM